MINIDKIEALAEAAPRGKWEVWTSNSWRRVYAGGVPAITPCVQRHDNHPDLSFGDGVREWLEGVTPDVVAELVAEVRSLREDLQATKLLAHANGEMFRAEKVEGEKYRQAQKDCQALSFELLGVIIDTEQGHGFDSVCLDTIKRVRDRLHEISSA